MTWEGESNPTPLALGPFGGSFVSGAARAARFSDCNAGRLAPCRYNVSGIGEATAGAEAPMPTPKAGEPAHCSSLNTHGKIGLEWSLPSASLNPSGAAG